MSELREPSAAALLKLYRLVATNFKASGPAEVFTCRFEDRAGWAVMMIHDHTGTVAIDSDYGSWVYSWTSAGRGQKSIKEFLCNCSCDYLASKFEQGRPEVFNKGDS